MKQEWRETMTADETKTAMTMMETASIERDNKGEHRSKRDGMI